MESKLLIATALNDHVRIHLADTREIVEKARTLHNMYPTSLAALGRTLSVAVIMGNMLKGDGENVTITINGGGPIGTVMAIANNEGKVKGFVGDSQIYQKYDNSNKLAVGLAVGKDGYLEVTKDLRLKERFVSRVALQSGEIGDDFAYYFSISEQVPSIVSVGVLVDTDYTCKSAGAMIIELLPNHTEEDIQYLENLTKTLKPISSVLAEDNNLYTYVNSLFTDAKVLEVKEIEYSCDCSRERFLGSLATLPRKDLEELRSEDGFEIRCEFCEKVYKFTASDIDLVLSYVKNS